MTFNARLYLMDLDQNGVGPLTEADPTTCSPLIQEMAFVSMVRPRERGQRPERGGGT